MSNPDLRPRRGGKKAFQFNMIVVGASGLGKATFINTLCGQQVIPRRNVDDPAQCAAEKSIAINPITVELEEDGIKMQLTVVDTPGFGDNIDNSSNFNTILGYVERQYDDVLAEESKIKRNPKFLDNRIHVLLYFIQPTGHSLRELDIELMKRLSARVNIIPCIAKSDTMTPRELIEFKKRVMEDIRFYDIHVYDFPYDEEDDDEETIQENMELRSLLPFAIVGSDEEIMVNGRLIRGRQYPWGVVEVENLKHCDYARLRYVLLSSHLQDLKEITHDVLYEQYRSEKLSKLEGLAEKVAAMHVQQSVGSFSQQ
ncbi:Septin-type guanine nucleotide-binding (G) domain-containing protein [Catenaria anguillulae PL171]|uniref:Septin-type guanine nucleotide-binding (G) domain-containing protein n=1 Tax=Catenaria anguillulae PL171 TaxID=765915 RepID=A0A1Y2HAZ4_9FUNG|nr:Septin-type guanine nucleotide-binding (G) domain-containing protein [Catenaria anguillulae PL171]